MTIKNGNGSLKFDDQNTHFKTDTATLNGNPISVDGTCTLLGVLNFKASTLNQKSQDLLKIIRTSPMLKDIQNLISPINTANGLMNVNLSLTGEVKDIYDVVLNKNIFAEGKLELLNNTVSIKNIPVNLKNLSGNINFNNLDADFNLSSNLDNSKIRTNGKLKDKILNTETEVEKDTIKSIEMFKKIVTSDEVTVEQKYKDPAIIKPFCKLIFATNNLPQLNTIDDEGYYRRLFILPFNRRFTDEEVNNFDISELLTEDALNYLANTSLQEYLKIADTKKLTFAKGSNQIINKYKHSNNSHKVFLDDETIINEIFINNNIVPRTVMYSKYVSWCNEMKFFIKKKDEFYNEVLSRPEYQEVKGLGGKDCFKNTNKTTTPTLPQTF